jgi:radical SAM superfamily enzyme YgiQ (UPF0313 family)
LPAGVIQRGATASPFLRRLSFALPMRDALPPLDKYARLEHKGERRVVGYAEASRGCLHLCTHCPIPPVYGGRFFVVPEDVVLADVRNQVAAGATHITFGDPDFLNGPGHALGVARALHAEFPSVTFDITTKVEHILKRGDILPELGRLGCLFLISAVESVSDTVLGILEKNHTKADIEAAIKVVRAAGIAPRPTWVAFTPWTTLGDYLDMLAFIEANGLIDHVDPVQYTIRLLVPPAVGPGVVQLQVGASRSAHGPAAEEGRGAGREGRAGGGGPRRHVLPRVVAGGGAGADDARAGAAVRA